MAGYFPNSPLAYIYIYIYIAWPETNFVKLNLALTEDMPAARQEILYGGLHKLWMTDLNYIRASERVETFILRQVSPHPVRQFAWTITLIRQGPNIFRSVRVTVLFPWTLSWILHFSKILWTPVLRLNTCWSSNFFFCRRFNSRRQWIARFNNS